MTSSAPNAYLRDSVMTASPEQLQLMLYDGAIRFATEGREAVSAKNYEAAYERLSRAQKIVLEMERGLRPEIAPELCGRLSALYMFVYRRLVDGCVQHTLKPIDEALDVLRFERDTWVMLLDKVSATKAGADAAASESHAPMEGATLSIEG